MKLVWLSDFDIKGSGYKNISAAICAGLIDKGHEVKAIGLGYNMEEHQFPFQLLPARSIRESSASILNLQNSWKADAVVVALDIPVQEQIINAPYLKDRTLKYVGMFPLESDPLCFSWAAVLMQMDKSLVISQFGTDEVKRFGVNADHVQVGLDTEAWAVTTPEQKSKLRSSFGFDDETFVVLTVADNQERKNLATAMDMFASFSKDKPNTRYILVTREHNPVGWKLRDYANEIGISDKFMIFERGMSHRDLWVTYAISDVFLLTSKAEGLGLPLLEAMAVGIPCIATDCTGMKELLSDGRGFLLKYQFIHRDPFGNGRRYWVAPEHGVNHLGVIYMNKNSEALREMVTESRKYVEARTWDIAVEQTEKALLEVCE